MGKEISLSSIEEQLDEAQDLVILADSASSDSFVTIAEELDPITQAIRQEILQKQRNILKEYIAHHFDATVDDYDDQEFVKYLKNVNNCSITNQAFADSKVKADLEKAEIVGYKKVHYRFADQFHPINWQDGERQENVRAQIVKNNYGDELATIQETTHKIKETLVLSDGTSKQINSYRTIDLPTKLLNKTGPMHLSLAVRDEYGRNIAKDRAVYFTAHYDSQGKLLEISSPKPVKFNGVGDDAIGYIEHLGQIYTLPVTQGKYRAMMLEVERNNGQEVNLSQISSIAQDNIITNNITTTNIDLSKQQDKKQYYQKGKKLAEEKLTQVAQHYRLAKERSEIITKGLQYDYNRDNAGNRQLFEQQAANFKTVHDLTPQQAIIKYQEILDILQPKVKVRDQERKLLQQLAKQYPALAAKSVAKHFILHAAAYNQEKTEDASSKALEELEVTVEICGGYKNLGLIPITKPLPEFSKIKQQSAKMVKEADQLIAELEAADQSLQEELKKIQALADNLPESNPNKKKLNIFVKLKLEEQEAIRTGNPLSKSKERDEYLRRATADKQIDQGTKERKVAPSDYRTITERIIGKLVGRDYKSHSNKAGEKTSLICKVSPNHDTIVSPPLTPKVQLNKTPVNKR